MKQPFVHLGVHSEYSLEDSVIRIPDLIRQVKAHNMNAIALTDRCNLFGAVKFYEQAVSAGIKPIIGAQLTLARPSPLKGSEHVLVFCKNRVGYTHLCRLLSCQADSGGGIGRAIPREHLFDTRLEGLMLILGYESEVGRLLLLEQAGSARAELEIWQKRYGQDVSLAVSRIGIPQEALVNDGLETLAGGTGVPLVATNEVRFLLPDEYEAHEARVCIQSGWTLNDRSRERRFTEHQYLKSSDEMSALFADRSDALDNTVDLARCCNFEFELDRILLPAYPVPSGQSPEQLLREKAETGLRERLTALSQKTPSMRATHEYTSRLAAEISVIEHMGFAGYFLIVADFIDWAKAHDIPVGPGRGSGAGSLVAYSLGITDLDPLEHGLLFERFLNPERVTMPDFDIDFCIEGRDRVIRYVEERYGKDCVAQIATFGTMAARAVVRDVVRVLGLPYGFADRLAKLIPFEIHMTLERALESEPELKAWYESDENVHTVIDLAKKIEGRVRSVGKHAGGVVIAPQALTNHLPLFSDTESDGYITQFDKDDLEHLGLVKFDFLGLKTLTIINRTLKTIRHKDTGNAGASFSLDAISMRDAETFRLLQSCETTAIFQLESHGMRDLIRRLQPDRFEDIVALVALFRPGPLQSGMVNDFISRKHGQAPIVYSHPTLKSILEDTYGVILYQEQVMQIAQELAGYSLGAADLLRRAMGKKKPEEMALQRSVFVTGAEKRGVPARKAQEIFDLMEKFAGYGFNKSHSVAYALLAYQTAWLKAHHPAAFMASVLTGDMDHTEKLLPLLLDCRRMGVKILPPDINRSAYGFAVEERDIRYGLGAIKGVGQSIVESIEQARLETSFVSLEDFCERMGSHLNRRALEALIKAGSFDSLGTERIQLIERMDSLIAMADQYARSARQVDLFGLPRSDSGSLMGRAVQPKAPDVTNQPTRVLLESEKEVLGLYLSGHPLDQYRSEWKSLGLPTIESLLNLAEAQNVSGTIQACGLIEGIRRRGERGQGYLDDGTGRLDCVIFGEALLAKIRSLPTGEPVVAEGQISFDDFTGNFRIRVREIQSYTHWRGASCRRLILAWKSENPDADARMDALKIILERHRGQLCRVSVHYETPSGRMVLDLAETDSVEVTDALLLDLRAHFGPEAVELEPHKRLPGSVTHWNHTAPTRPKFSQQKHYRPGS
ncbi:DNA polymerase III subunit alpha [mine drainage metagenome]|uniref:DNA polymerase III subunit alpha n=4 Tax=mine drainage metagenome TaxID=410659 RepID=T0ZZM2_9ZZZZ